MPIGPWELAIILMIVVIIFGAGKLPEVGGALGKGIREFRVSATEPGDVDAPAPTSGRQTANTTAIKEEL